MSVRKKIDTRIQKVVERRLDTNALSREQQASIRGAVEMLQRANLCLVMVDEDGKELVFANHEAREMYDEAFFSGWAIDLTGLGYLESQVVTIDSNELRRQLEDADDDVRRLGEALKMRERAAAELRAAMSALPASSKTPIQDRLISLSGQHELVQKSRSKS